MVKLYLSTKVSYPLIDISAKHVKQLEDELLKLRIEYLWGMNIPYEED